MTQEKRDLKAQPKRIGGRYGIRSCNLRRRYEEKDGGMLC